MNIKEVLMIILVRCGLFLFSVCGINLLLKIFKKYTNLHVKHTNLHIWLKIFANLYIVGIEAGLKKFNIIDQYSKKGMEEKE
jgi:hypothetical protein